MRSAIYYHLGACAINRPKLYTQIWHPFDAIASMVGVETLDNQTPEPTGTYQKYLASILGVAFTFVMAYAGTRLASLPILSRFGPMICAIFLAVLYRQVKGYPDRLKPGIQFSSKVLLRVAIVLFGFRLNLAVVMKEGLGLLVRGLGTVTGAILLTLTLAKWLKADRDLSMLVGVGTGVCGAAAIAAVSPIIGAKDEDTAVGVGIIALTGTLFTVIYTFLRPLIPFTPLEYGVWTGVSLHEIAHVAAAAAPAGEEALALALLAKLGRVLLLIPLSLILMYWAQSKNEQSGRGKVEFPWFLAGFALTSIIGSYAPIPTSALNRISTLTSLLLTSAMVGLGLNISLKTIGGRAAKPWLAVIIASVVLSAVTYLTI